jgi:hypothetical protein
VPNFNSAYRDSDSLDLEKWGEAASFLSSELASLG